VNTDGTGFSILKQFSQLVWDPVSMAYTNSDGAFPRPGPVWGNTHYGTTSWGGKFGLGTVFKINSDGTGFAVIAHIGDTDLPTARDTHVPLRLVLSGSSLFFAGQYGGQGGAGAIFRLDLSPTLSIACTKPDSLAVSWPSVWTNYVLQQNVNGLSSLNWSNDTDAIQNDGTNKTLIVNSTGQSRFYRLVSP
jgi:uncharacterized repeat protein (TIGR03803 family)